MEIIALKAQIQALHQAVNGAATTMNARGDLLVDRLQDIPNCAREITIHRVRQGLQLLWLWRKFVPGTSFFFWTLSSLKKMAKQASTSSFCNLM